MQFVTRTEFRAIYDGLNNTQYVDKLFQTTGVTPTAADRQALIDGLNGGSETRASVLFKVVDGTTTTTGGVLVFNTTYGKAFYDNLFNAAFVQMEYFGYLLRDPDDGGYAFWLGQVEPLWRLGKRGDGEGVHQVAGIPLSFRCALSTVDFINLLGDCDGLLAGVAGPGAHHRSRSPALNRKQTSSL